MNEKKYLKVPKATGLGKNTPLPVRVAADVIVHNGGTIFQFEPVTAAGKDWINSNVESEPWQWFGSTLVVDHRHAGPLAEGMIEAGLVVV